MLDVKKTYGGNHFFIISHNLNSNNLFLLIVNFFEVIFSENVSLLERENAFSKVIQNLHRTKNWKPSKKTHRSSNGRKLHLKIGPHVIADLIHCWGIEVDVHVSEILLRKPKALCKKGVSVYSINKSK